MDEKTQTLINLEKIKTKQVIFNNVYEYKNTFDILSKQAECLQNVLKIIFNS